MPEEKDREQVKKIMTFPHLVSRELICILVVTGLLTLLSIIFNAPLEDPPSPTRMPSPTKAPWYFLGLQELLVYFDPWLAGVVVPLIIVAGLIAIPYVDVSPELSGTFDYSKRKLPMIFFAWGTVLWFVLIIIGEFFRGPSWLWYWPWESWETHKDFPPPAVSLPNWLGLSLLIFYFGGGLVLTKRCARNFYVKLGPVNYTIQMIFMLLGFGVLIKIILRLFFNVKYILQTPWFNI